MEKLPRRVDTAEFSRQAVELVKREGLSIAEASRRLSLSPKTLTNWVRRARGNESPAAVAQRPEAIEAEAELSRLRRENAELWMEHNILKKASAYLAQESTRRRNSLLKFFGCGMSAGCVQEVTSC
jgi:transposase